MSSKAAQFRSEGEGKKDRDSRSDGEGAEIHHLGSISDGRRDPGKADAEATRIYGVAYGQDPAFYAFFKTLETYKGVAYKNSFVILGTDSDYYRFLKTIPK